ncbi:MAG TPA: hypothetical protein ENJ96_04995 [Thermodesulfatator atlanticus]|uniref:Uncharacterized protein n=1 Tax=Thermodesulfatator atlanticus TaxID=501497 RepID=A0A7V5NZT5_9BACT|nr:hypothetical protein [Thermodesulfatator atlanticus]
MQTVIFAIGKPEKLAVGRLSLEEKEELLMKESLDLDEGVGDRSVFDINDYLEEFGVDFDSIEDFEGPGLLGLDPEELRRKAVVLPFKAPERGNFLVFKRFLISKEEFAARFLFPFPKAQFQPARLIPLVFDFSEFCGAESLLVGFFYVQEEEKTEEVVDFLRLQLRKVPPARQPRFSRELEAALLEGRLPHGPSLPAPLSFHPALPLEADFDETYEAQILEVRPGESECYSLEIEKERPLIEG